ncbi:MAG: outer membrane beta-barrel protein [Elusimicrobiaceae bacterium]|nr:outer membrane beta-barrel protein [Elusimicrobiaceae bacterium]
MKKRLLFLLFLISPLLINGEAIKLKSGLIINGSIVGQTEYILNVKTSYGTIAINQREVEKIMPDLHRVILKGGGEFIGNIVDMDEFTLSLNTDNGLVNIDVPQISSMEIYDYNEAEKQKKYIETKHELEEQAAQELSQKNAQASDLEQAQVKAAAGSTISASGLEFDSDLEKLFPSKPVVEAPKDVYVRYDNKNTPEEKQEPKKETKKIDETSQAFKKDFSKNNFEVFLGYQNLPLKLDLTEEGLSDKEDISSSNIAFGISYLRKINNRLWFGADLGMGMLSKHNFEPNATTHIETSGQAYNIDLKANYYLNPKSITRLYLQGGAGLTSTSVNKNINTFNGTDWIQEDTKTISSTNVSALFGLGIERSIADLNLGLEFKGRYNTYSGKLKGSDNLSFMLAAKINWYF